MTSARDTGTRLRSTLREPTEQGRLGAALLALRKRAPKAPLSTLYDKHEKRLREQARA